MLLLSLCEYMRGRPTHPITRCRPRSQTPHRPEAVPSAALSSSARSAAAFKSKGSKSKPPGAVGVDKRILPAPAVSFHTTLPAGRVSLPAAAVSTTRRRGGTGDTHGLPATAAAHATSTQPRYSGARHRRGPGGPQPSSPGSVPPVPRCGAACLPLQHTLRSGKKANELRSAARSQATHPPRVRVRRARAHARRPDANTVRTQRSAATEAGSPAYAAGSSDLSRHLAGGVGGVALPTRRSAACAAGPAWRGAPAVDPWRRVTLPRRHNVHAVSDPRRRGARLRRACDSCAEGEATAQSVAAHCQQRLPGPAACPQPG
eukprot:135038-Chlamydomonas_euryale.AAC.4